MSGCVVSEVFSDHTCEVQLSPEHLRRQNCVYTIYTDEVLEYNDALALASETLRSNSVPLSTWPEELRPRRKSGSKIDNEEADADGVIKRKTKEEIKREAMEDLDPSLRAFLE
jgi:hypothetical protein